MVCPKFNSHVCKLKRWEHFCFYFVQLGVQRGAFIGGVPNVPKLLMLGQSIWLLENKIKIIIIICECRLEQVHLINMMRSALGFRSAKSTNMSKCYKHSLTSDRMNLICIKQFHKHYCIYKLQGFAFASNFGANVHTNTDLYIC